MTSRYFLCEPCTATAYVWMRPKLTTVKPMQTAIVKPTLRSSATRKVASAKDASTARQLFRTERSRKDAEALTLAALADSLYQSVLLVSCFATATKLYFSSINRSMTFTSVVLLNVQPQNVALHHC